MWITLLYTWNQHIYKNLLKKHYKIFLNKKYDSLINIFNWINRNFALLPSEFSTLIYYETNGLPDLWVLYNHTHYPTAPPSPQPLVHWSVLYFHNVVILGFFFYRIICSIWEFFLTQHNSLKIYPGCCMYQLFLLSNYWAVFHGMDVLLFV